MTSARVTAIAAGASLGVAAAAWWLAAPALGLVALGLGTGLAIGAAALALSRGERAREPEADVPAHDANEDVSAYDQVLYAVSHDLRSPIGAMLNYAVILDEDYADALDDDARHVIARMRSSAANAMDRIEALLELSRAGRRELAPEDGIDPTPMVEDIVADEVAAGVRTVIGPLPPVRADRVALRRIWLELLRNASRHCAGATDPMVTVSGQREGDRIAFQISDNGDGFDMRFSSKLFRPFERLHAADEKSGTGMGLALVAALVRRHGGRVSAEGALGEGATFRFTLPASGAMSSGGDMR